MNVNAQLLEAGLSGVIDYALLESIALAASTSPPNVLDQLACYVARQYARGASPSSTVMQS